MPEDEGQHLQDVFPRATETGGVRFGCSAAAYLDETSSLITEANSRRIWNSWSRWWDPSKSVYVEKSPPNIAKFAFLQAIFKDAGSTVFIAVVRHPIALMRARFFGFGGKETGKNEIDQDYLRENWRNKLDCWWVVHGGGYVEYGVGERQSEGLACVWKCAYVCACVCDFVGGVSTEGPVLEVGRWDCSRAA